MARPEPFRALLEKAFQADLAPPGPLGPRSTATARRPLALHAEPARPVLAAVLAAVAPPPALDDEHKSQTLERRLDAAIRAAGATPPRGLRPPRLPEREMVPLRLQSPFEIKQGSQPPQPVPTQSQPAQSQSVKPAPAEAPVSTRANKPVLSLARSVSDVTCPAPRVLQFLSDQLDPGLPLQGRSGRHFGESRGATDDSNSLTRMPRLEPVHDSQRLPVAVGIHTNVYRLRSLEDEATPARPLPAVSLELVVGELETRKLRGRDKVMTRDSLNGLGVEVRAFSSDDMAVDVDDLTHEGSFADTDERERFGRSAAAVALPALSDEMELDPVDIDFANFDDLDELAAQLGLHGVSVPRALPLDAAPIAVIDEDLEVIESDDVELVAVAAPSPSDPFGAVVMGRLAAMPSLAGLDGYDDGLDEEGHDDDGLDDDTEITAPRGAARSLLPQSLFSGADANLAASDDLDHAGDDGLDDDDITPARGTARPAIVAPQAVRFVVADAPARPRHEALSAEEKLRNKTRARDLYLVAMDDLGDGDASGAIVHLELAIAYDDETSLYLDLLEQLKKKRA